MQALQIHHQRHWAAGVILALALMPQALVNAASPDPELSDVMKEFLKTPANNAGAHRQSDPHASLSAEKMAQVALQHLDESRDQLAFDTLDAAIARYPDDTMLLSIRASLLLQSERTSQALADLNRAVSINPHDPVILTNRAQALRQFDRKNEAMSDLDRAIKLDPNFVAAYFNRGSLNYEAARFDQALVDFNRCVELEPEAPAAYFNRASALDALGERARAIDDLQFFLTLSPQPNWAQIARDMLAQWDSDQS